MQKEENAKTLKRKPHFIIIESQEDIPSFYNIEFLKDIFLNEELFENPKQEENEDNNLTNWLESLFEKVSFPLTIVYEDNYVDRVYRDEYYKYYSSKHFILSRNCKRFVLFKGKYYEKDFLSVATRKHRELEKNLIGTFLIKPTKTIGRVLLNPHQLHIQSCYLRTTEFNISVLGRMYNFEAFPASGQDNEAMTCAEVNVWQIMEYFGTRYKDYRVILPGEMLDLLKTASEVRVLPSEGLTVEQESFVFLRSGFSPKVYSKDEYNNEERLISPGFKKILHLYVESGIPILLNASAQGEPYGDYHSFTCIGHEAVNYTEEELKNILYTERNFEIDSGKDEVYNNFHIFSTSTCYKRYVLLEDHSVPYQLKPLDDLSFGDGSRKWNLESFVVPLYKHVFMTAEDAYDVVFQIVENSSDRIAESIEHKSEVLLRLFLTTSRAYKEFRICHSKSKTEKIFYSEMELPKFLWVCEYSTIHSYCNHRVIGEFILDATSSKLEPLNSVISIRYSDMVSYRSPEDSVSDAFHFLAERLNKEFDSFEQNNLKLIENN